MQATRAQAAIANRRARHRQQIAIVEQVRAELGGVAAPLIIIDGGDVDGAARALRDLLDVPA